MTSNGDHPATDDRVGAAAPAATLLEDARVRGDALAARVKTLIHEANVRRIVVKDSAGQSIVEIPVTAGLLATAVAPVLTGVAAIAALAGDWRVEVHRDDEAFAP